MTTSLEQQREDQALGAAWRRCAAAMPEGWEVLSLTVRADHVNAQAWGPDRECPACGSWEAAATRSRAGNDVVAVLTALAVDLEARAAE